MTELVFHRIGFGQLKGRWRSSNPNPSQGGNNQNDEKYDCKYTESVHCGAIAVACGSGNCLVPAKFFGFRRSVAARSSDIDVGDKFRKLQQTRQALVVAQLVQETAREGMPKAREAAMTALSLDANLVEAHTTLGLIDTYAYDFAGAESEYKRAIELNPNYTTAHQWYGVMLFYLARHEEAFTQLRWALEIDPLSLITNLCYGDSLFYARRYDDASAQLKKTLELDAGFARTHQSLANVYQAKGNYVEAVEEFAKYQELTGEQQTAAQVRESFTKGGWQGFLRAMTGEQRSANLSAYEKVLFHVALGEKGKAFAELNKSYEVFGRVLKVDPLLDTFRDDPRFAEMMRRVGLTQQ